MDTLHECTCTEQMDQLTYRLVGHTETGFVPGTDLIAFFDADSDDDGCDADQLTSPQV